MPVVGEFHTQYWMLSDTNVTGQAATGRATYPMWQSVPTVTMYMATPLGIVWLALERFWQWARDVGRLLLWVLRLNAHGRTVALRLCPKLRFDLSPEQEAVFVRVGEALTHPCYPLAQQCVRKTATTLGFNRPEAWKPLSHAIKRSPGEAENMYRHLEACRLLREQAVSSTVSNPDANLLIELAYHGFRVKG